MTAQESIDLFLVGLVEAEAQRAGADTDGDSLDEGGSW